MRSILLVSFICSFFSFAIKAQELNINGTVKDIKTKEVLIGANVSYNSASGVSTNSYGFYFLKHSKGHVQLFCSYIGYETEILDL